MESLIWDVASRVLVLGVDVIHDFGCWVRSQRDEFRSREKELGVDFKIHLLGVSEDLLLERLKIRNQQNRNGTFLILEAKLKEWIIIFEAPSSEDLE